MTDRLISLAPPGQRPDSQYAFSDVHAQRQVPAWVLSVALHATMFVLLALFFRVPQRGVAVEADRMTGLVLFYDEAGETAYYQDAAAATTEPSHATSAVSAAAAVPAADALQLDLPGLLPTKESGGLLDGIGNDLTAALPSADSLTAGGSRSKRIDGETDTYVFGVKGTGSKFVYVFDRSGSMDGFQSRPLAAAKSELVKSLASLEPIHQFQIIFYNERTSIFNPYRPSAPRLIFGDEQHKALAKQYVRSIAASGGTHHIEALKLALRMSPDVIFFLTDAADPRLTPDELDDIRRRNGRLGAAIHAIEFGAGTFNGRTNFLVKLAAQNGGQHTYVDVTQLPLPK